MNFITGAAPETGFNGAEFGENYKRQNRMPYESILDGSLEYTTENQGTQAKTFRWRFKRRDTEKTVDIIYNLALIEPVDMMSYMGKLESTDFTNLMAELSTLTTAEKRKDFPN